MGILDNLGNFLSSAKTTETQGTNNAGGRSTNNSAAISEAEVALGQELAGVGKENEAPETTAEKASSALEDLMGKLGLTIKEDFDSELEDFVAKEAEKSNNNEEVTEGEEANSIVETEKTDLKSAMQDLVENATKLIEPNKLEDLLSKFKEEASFTPKEASTYAAGESEIQKRLDAANEANADNPDYDAEVAEKEIRESYAIENPDYAAAAEEANEVQSAHDEAMTTEYDKYCEENPAPKESDYDNPDEYLKAQSEWTKNAQEHMADVESDYIQNNPDYANKKRAEFIQNLKDNLEQLPSGGLEPVEPTIIRPTLPLEPIDPGIELPTYPIDPTGGLEPIDPGIELPTYPIEPTGGLGPIDPGIEFPTFTLEPTGGLRPIDPGIEFPTFTLEEIDNPTLK